MLGDPALLVAGILRDAFPGVTVDTETISPHALSDNRYVYVHENGGLTPDEMRIDNPDVEVICYGQGGKATVSSFARECQRALVQAWLDQTVDPVNGSLAFVQTNIRPYVQEINGLKLATRVYAQYTLWTRPPRS